MLVSAANSVSTPVVAGEDHMDLDVVDKPAPRPGMITIYFTPFYGLDLSTHLNVSVAASYVIFLDDEQEPQHIAAEQTPVMPATYALGMRAMLASSVPPVNLGAMATTPPTGLL